MANSDKNILITPATNAAGQPTIEFKGFDVNSSNIKIVVADDGSLSFEGGTGQLFSVADNQSGTIYSVNDVSGIPSIEVFDSGNVNIAEFGGAVRLGQFANIDVDGNIMFHTDVTDPGNGNTSTGVSVRADSLFCVSRDATGAVFNRNTTDGAVVSFGKDGVGVGTISVTATTTAYNTSSDYRLKENVQPISDAFTRVLNLNPVRFSWINTGEEVDGFLAHEAQAVVPEAVTGTYDDKDVETIEHPEQPEVRDEEDNVISEAVAAWTETIETPVYQSIDQSKLVPLLTAALKDAINEINALKQRVTDLETP